jgi:hypothetical protein
MHLDNRQFLGHRPIKQTAAVAARAQRQPVPFEDRPQHCRIAGKFVAELDPLEPRQTRLGMRMGFRFGPFMA